jgi:hypothetical protein
MKATNTSPIFFIVLVIFIFVLQNVLNLLGTNFVISKAIKPLISVGLII